MAGTAGVLLALTSAACSSTKPTSPPSSATSTVQVLAAASLRGPFTQLARDFEKEHPGTVVRLSFAGSSDLAAQTNAFAPAAVLATADEATMAKVERPRIAGAPRRFASNTLTIVTPPGNPRQVTGLQSLSDKGIRLVVCAPQVPCGAATTRLARLAGATLSPVSEESSVTDVLGKVTSGDADAGIVYVTDAKAAGAKVDAVAVPSATQVVNHYPIAVLADVPPGPPTAFVDLVLGQRGQDVLRAAGFGPP